MCGKPKDILILATMCETHFTNYKNCLQTKNECKEEYSTMIECYKRLVFS